MKNINTLWQTVGGAIVAPILLTLLAIDRLNYGYLSAYEFILWLNLVFLLFHEWEEHVLNPDGFKYFFNHHSVFAKKPFSTNAPLNEELIFAINFFALTWATVSAVFAQSIPWLGMSFLITNSLLNGLAHTLFFQFSYKGYNPGLITVVFLFIPFYTIVLWYTITCSLLSSIDWSFAIVIGILMVLLISSLPHKKRSS